jgi:hypothetical protein
MPFLVIAASRPIKLKNHFSGYQTITVSDDIHNDKPVSEDKSLTAYKQSLINFEISDDELLAIYTL